jgi:hypothetical protein
MGYPIGIDDGMGNCCGHRRTPTRLTQTEAIRSFDGQERYCTRRAGSRAPCLQGGARHPENHLSLKLGQAVRITVDSFPGRTFAGRIAFVTRRAKFTPSNVQTPEDRSQQVFRIKVNLIEGLDVLRPGMAADVWLESEGTTS